MASSTASQVLQGRRILLTGASRGVGLECARLFLASGARVIGAAKDPERLAAAAVTRDFGGALDILFNNAGIMSGSDGAVSEPPGNLEKTLQVNLIAVHNLIRGLLPALLKGKEPRILNTSSGAGNVGAVGENSLASYRVSKFALNGLTLNWAGALKGQVAVNASDPGWVKTDMGGPNAPGTPQESARGALDLVLKPFPVTGKFWKDGSEIPW